MAKQKIEELEQRINDLENRLSKIEIDKRPYGPIPDTWRPTPMIPGFPPLVPDKEEWPWPFPKQPKGPFMKQDGCPVCGIGANGEVLGYVCIREDCHSRITC